MKSYLYVVRNDRQHDYREFNNYQDAKTYCTVCKTQWISSGLTDVIFLVTPMGEEYILTGEPKEYVKGMLQLFGIPMEREVEPMNFKWED